MFGCRLLTAGARGKSEGEKDWTVGEVDWTGNNGTGALGWVHCLKVAKSFFSCSVDTFIID